MWNKHACTWIEFMLRWQASANKNIIIILGLLMWQSDIIIHEYNNIYIFYCGPPQHIIILRILNLYQLSLYSNLILKSHLFVI